MAKATSSKPQKIMRLKTQRERNMEEGYIEQVRDLLQRLRDLDERLEDGMDAFVGVAADPPTLAGLYTLAGAVSAALTLILPFAYHESETNAAVR